MQVHLVHPTRGDYQSFDSEDAADRDVFFELVLDGWIAVENEAREAAAIILAGMGADHG